MAKKCLFVSMMINSCFLFSAELTIQVKDVLDLATYEEVFTQNIRLSTTKEKREFFINDWYSAVDNRENYSIKLKIEVTPIKNELLNDVAYVISVLKELLLNGRVCAVLARDSFVLKPGQEKIIDDHYWGQKGLVVRQKNIFSIKI